MNPRAKVISFITGSPLKSWRSGLQVTGSLKLIPGCCLALILLMIAGGLEPLGALEGDGRLTLTGAIDLALKQHPAIREYKEKATAARDQIGISRAALLPQVGFSWSYYYGTSFGRGPGLLSATTPSGVTTAFTTPVNFFIYRFTVNQLLFDFGKTPGQVAVSRAAYNQAEEDLSGTRQKVVLEARTSYYGYLAALRAQKVEEENVRQNRELLKQAQGFYQVGLRAKIDVTKAEANLFDAEANLLKAKNQVDVARVSLMTALGLKTWPFREVEDTFQVEHRLPGLSELKAQALKQRPEILKNKYQKEGNEAAIRVARAGFFPTLSSTASYGWQGTDYPLGESWWVGATVNFPLFEGLSTTHALRQAKANLRATEANYEVLAQDIMKEVEQSYLEVQSAWEVIRATAKAKEAAQENLRLAWGRYQAGVGNIIEVTDAQVQFAQADLKYVRAVYDYLVAGARLDKAVGKAF